jgi:ribulose-5-phosphate 4-epimerase/fuculose-1-phosphate aldolase
MHTHTTAGSAVACLRDGLDWNNFHAAQIYQQVAYHEFEASPSTRTRSPG